MLGLRVLCEHGCIVTTQTDSKYRGSRCDAETSISVRLGRNTVLQPCKQLVWFTLMTQTCPRTGGKRYRIWRQSGCEAEVLERCG